MTCPSHSSLFDHPHNIWWGVQIIKFHMLSFCLLPCYLVPLRPKYPPQHIFSNTLSLRSSLNVSDQVSHAYNTIGNT
jgi:hypothetical protein